MITRAKTEVITTSMGSNYTDSITVVPANPAMIGGRGYIIIDNELFMGGFDIADIKRGNATITNLHREPNGRYYVGFVANFTFNPAIGNNLPVRADMRVSVMGGVNYQVKDMNFKIDATTGTAYFGDPTSDAISGSLDMGTGELTVIVSNQKAQELRSGSDGRLQLSFFVYTIPGE